ncbi:MAG: 3-dehydroquinate synthase [Rhodothermales bacterium]
MRPDSAPPVPVPLGGGRTYAIHLRPLADAPALLHEAGLRVGPCLVVTDANVAALYLRPLREAVEAAGWTVHTQILPPGEETKSAAHLTALHDWALELGLDRKTPLLALGGGVVGDLAGFAAATLLRGLPLVHLPTTLVAQADSAIGGKTGINHATGKNLIGTFWQPRFVLADPATLQTLPEREWTSGLAEVVKAALIADADFFAWLDARWEDVMAREPEAVAALVRRAAGIKAEIVAEDEREAGRRALLNFGHTFGHAIERAAGYGTFTHGEAVAVGMRAALHLSHALRPDASFDRADALVARLPVPSGLATIPTAALTTAMQTDKKRDAGQLRFVVLDEIGRARLADGVTPEAVAAAWAYAKNTRYSADGAR